MAKSIKTPGTFLGYLNNFKSLSALIGKGILAHPS